MKKILKEGRITLLLPEGEGGGLTGETYLIEHNNKKYVLRKCETLSKAEYYEHLLKKFAKYNFFPKFFGRIGKNVMLEYIEGRDLKEKGEKIEYFKQIGKILGIINKFEFESRFENLFIKQLKELTSGKYAPSLKVQIARKKRDIHTKPKKVLEELQAQKILKFFNSLKKSLNPSVVYECTDPMPSNFRLRKNKIYLVDIDSIKPRYKGMGISKFFLEWGKTPLRRNKFTEGYKQNNSLSFFTHEYKKFMDLNFLIQKLNFQTQTGKNYSLTIEKVKLFVKNK